MNTTTAESQTQPAMAMDANGNFVVVWQSYGTDGDGQGIFAQRYDNTGAPLGGEFQVNVLTAGNQTQPDVAMRADGTFVVAWTGPDNGDTGIYARFYDAVGNGLAGSERLINATRTGRHGDAAVAFASDRVLFAWTSDDDGSQDGVYARPASFTGSLGSEFRVNQTLTGAQFAPAVALNAGGQAVIAWTGNAQSGGESFDVYARRFDSSGTALAGEQRVNTTIASRQWLPGVALNAAGDFAVTWQSDAQDGDGDGIFARSYDSSGTALSGEVAVNGTTADAQTQPAIRIASDGRFAVAWMSRASDGDDSGVYYRGFARTGAALTAEILANTVTAGAQNDPALALDAPGTLLALSWASASQDGDGFGIYLRLFPFGS